MGIFTKRPRPQPSAAAERVTLADPHDEGSPKQGVFIGLDQAGLSFLIYGPGNIRSCFAALSEAAPTFRTAELVSDSPYLGCFPGKSEIMWMALDGPSGSAIAVHCFPQCDNDFTTKQIATRVSGPRSALKPPWQFEIGTAGARVPAAFADVFDAARAVPLGLLPGLERLPVPDSERARHDDNAAETHPPVPAVPVSQPPTRPASPPSAPAPRPPAHSAPPPPARSAPPPQAPPVSPPTGRPVTRSAAPPAAQQPTQVLSLPRGANVSLSAQAPALSKVSVGLGWDVRTTSGAEFDLDASAIATDARGKVVDDAYFVFFNNLRSPDGSIVHTGDNRTGAGEGDDEVINVDLAAVPANIAKIVFVVSIYDADVRGQSFGQVNAAFIRVVNSMSGAELARYDLTENAATETAMIFGELYRRGAEWKFRAIGQGYDSGLDGIARDFGVYV